VRGARGIGTQTSICLLFLVSACGSQQRADLDTEPDSTSVITSTTTVPATTVPATTDTTERTGSTQADSGDGESSPCEITDSEAVRKYFGGTVDNGIEGFAENCTYMISGGAGGVQKVDVFYLGPAAEWGEIRTRYEETRMGIIEVEGIGDGAFHPVDHGARDIIFQTGGQIYSIVAFGGPTPEQLANIEPAVLSLASTIVNKQD
jgi:hypothetical protein